MSTDAPSRPAQARPDLAVPMDWTDFRPVSAMFIDLEGSVALMAQLGPEAYNTGLRAFHNLVTVQVRLLDGEVAQYLGDGVMCFFHRGRGDLGRAAAAITAGLRIIAALGQPGAQHFASVRIGIASGLALFNNEDTAAGARVIGSCVNLAARLQAEAEPGTILVCDESRRGAEDHFRLEARPGQRLKGFDDDIRVWQVRSARSRGPRKTLGLPAPAAPALPFLGRDADISLLRAALLETRAGRGQSAAVIGEAGLGKTRLVQEFLRDASTEDCAKLVLGCSRDEASRNFHPIMAYLRWVAGVTAADDELKRTTKLHNLFRAVWGLKPGQIDDLMLLLGVHADKDARPSGDPVVLRNWLCDELIARLIEMRGARPALIVVVEDVHWLDPSTAEFLAGLHPRLASERILLIFTQRTLGPEDRPARQVDRLIRLTPLCAPAETEMIRAVFGARAVDHGAMSWIRDKARGVPLFVSAFAQFARQKSGPDFSATGLPLDLLDLFEQSLSRLPDQTRRFVQAASVMGATFEPELIAALLGDSPEQMARNVALLVEEQIAGERPDGPGLGFAHDLVREAIYGNLGQQLRRCLHGQLADLMRARSADTPPHLLALHYESAGRPGEAIAQFLAASLASVRVGALQEARDDLGRAFALIGQLGSQDEQLQQELVLRSTEGPLQMMLGGPGSRAFGAAQRRSMDLMRALGLKQDRAHVLYNSGLHDWARLRLGAAGSMSREILALEETSDEASDEVRLAGHTLAGLVAWHQGDNPGARDHLHLATSLYRIEAHAAMFQRYLKDFGVFSLFYAGLTASVGADFTGARDFAARAQATSEAIGIPHARGFGLLAQFLTALLRDDPAAAAHHALLGEELARKHRFPEFLAMAIFVQGWAQCRDAASHAPGLARMIEGLAGWQRTDFLAWQSFFEAILIAELVRAGELAAAQAHLTRLKLRLAETGEHQFLAPALISEARLLAAEGQTDAACRCLDRAIWLARDNRAMLWQGRAEAARTAITKGRR